VFKGAIEIGKIRKKSKTKEYCIIILTNRVRLSFKELSTVLYL
jgi:hypothetical protein